MITLFEVTSFGSMRGLRDHSNQARNGKIESIAAGVKLSL
jgi:hypothetical protein